MTRVKETDPTSGDMPDYKSPANRLVHSLRKGYDNLRNKLNQARTDIKYYQIKTRDLEKSRKRYKKEVNDLKEKISQLEKQNVKSNSSDENNKVKKKHK